MLAVLQKGIAALREFRKAYREAMKRWLEGERDVAFPYGTWWMVKVHGAAVQPPLQPG